MHQHAEDQPPECRADAKQREIRRRTQQRDHARLTGGAVLHRLRRAVDDRAEQRQARHPRDERSG